MGFTLALNGVATAWRSSMWGNLWATKPPKKRDVDLGGLDNWLLHGFGRSWGPARKKKFMNIGPNIQGIQSHSVVKRKKVSCQGEPFPAKGPSCHLERPMRSMLPHFRLCYVAINYNGGSFRCQMGLACDYCLLFQMVLL